MLSSLRLSADDENISMNGSFFPFSLINKCFRKQRNGHESMHEASKRYGVHHVNIVVKVTFNEFLGLTWHGRLLKGI